MKPNLEQDQAPIDLTEDDRATEGAERAYVKMPPLSDRCGGSHDETLLVPIPEGIALPDCAQIIKGESSLS